MSKGSIFLQYFCNLFYFYLLGLINNKLIPEHCITHAAYQTFEYNIGTLGKLVNPSNSHLHPHQHFEKFSKFVPPDALKILIHPGSTCFLSSL